MYLGKVLAVIGTLGGVLIGGLITWFLERQRLAWERTARLDDTRRILYGQVLQEAHAASRRVADLRASLDKPDSATGALDILKIEQELAKDFTQLESRQGEVLLLATGPVLNAYVVTLELIVYAVNLCGRAASEEVSLKEWDSLQETMKEARIRFLEHARGELSIPNPR